MSYGYLCQIKIKLIIIIIIIINNNNNIRKLTYI